MSSGICLYHGSDLDGHCSGAIYAKAHTGQPHQLAPVDYGQLIPWDKLAGAYVTLVDFSFQPWNEVERLFLTARHVTWIDHHKSAITEWMEKHHLLPSGHCPFTTVLDTTRAGCELAWGHYFPDTPISRGVHLLGRYDVWDHTDPDVLPFQYGMRIQKTDPSVGDFNWDYVLEEKSDFLDTTIRDGKLLLQYQSQNDAAAVSKTWFPVTFADKRWQACNRLGKGSRFFDTVWTPGEFSGMLSFGWDGKKWQVGLYSDRSDMDCGAIAKQYGGGGHLGAAGFMCDTLPFALVEE